MDEQKYPKFIATLKIVENSWHGWSPEGSKIPPRENTIQVESGAFFPIQTSTHQYDIVWSEDSQDTETSERVDFEQKEGFRIFISWKFPTSVSFGPERRFKPINGTVYKLNNELPLKSETLKPGETFTVEKSMMDAGQKYSVTLVSIDEKK